MSGKLLKNNLIISYQIFKGSVKGHYSSCSFGYSILFQKGLVVNNPISVARRVSLVTGDFMCNVFM